VLLKLIGNAYVPKIFLHALSGWLIAAIIASAFSYAQDRQANDSQAEEPSISFTFQYAPWTEVLKWYADKAGLSLDSQDVPEGTFNYYDAKKYTVSQTLDVLNGYLIPKGYLLVRRDNFLVSLSIANGVPPSVIPNVSLEELPQRGRSELMRMVLPVHGMTAAEAATEIEKLLKPLGTVAILPSVNSLAITGLGDDLRQIQKLYGAAANVADAETVFRAFRLKHISALDADRTIRRFLDLPASDAKSSAPVASAAGSQKPAAIKMTYESRTNSLLVTAGERDLARIEQLLEAIDVPADDRVESLSKIQWQVIRLQGVKGANVSQAIEALLPGQISSESVGTSPSAVPVAPNSGTESQTLPGDR